MNTPRGPGRDQLIRSIGTGRMTREQLLACLDELADKVSETGVQGRLTLVGGAALSLSYDRPQGTVDIDASAWPSDPIMRAATAMANRYGLRSDWLNQAAVGYMPHDMPDPATVMERPGFIIEIAHPRVLLAMKLRACRASKDAYDLAWLLRECNIRSVEEAVAHLDEYFPEEELPKNGPQLVEALLEEIELPTRPPTILPVVNPRMAPSTCQAWLLTKDRRCSQPLGHDGEHL